MPTSESFQQLALRFIDPIQHDYEVIRGVVLTDETVAERSRVTGVDRDTIGEKAHRFLEQGMLGLVDRRTTTDRGRHRYPDVVARTILYLKQLYPRIHYREIARIVEGKYGYKTNHHTVKAFLERHPLPVQLPLEITHFHADCCTRLVARGTTVKVPPHWFSEVNRRRQSVLAIGVILQVSGHLQTIARRPPKPYRESCPQDHEVARLAITSCETLTSCAAAGPAPPASLIP